MRHLLVAALLAWPGPARAADPALEANAAAVRAVPRLHLEAVHAITPKLPGFHGSTDRVKLWVAPDFCRVSRDNGGVTTTGVRTTAGAKVASLPRVVGRNSPGSGAVGNTLAAGMRSTVLSDLLWWWGSDDDGKPLADYLAREGVRPTVRRESETVTWVELAHLGSLDMRRRVRLDGAHGFLADRMESEYAAGDKTARDVVEVSGFKPLPAGGWFPTGSTVTMFLDGKLVGTHRLTADLKATDFVVTPELLALKLPANISVHDAARKVMIKTDAAGNLTREEYPDVPPGIPAPTHAGPTPPTADDPPAVGGPTLVVIAGGLAVAAAGVVALRRRSQ